MSLPLRNIVSEQKRPPFQVNQLLGRDFDALTLTNYNYFERWIFPSTFAAQLETQNCQIPVVRSFRYNGTDRHNRDIAYLATIQNLHSLFIKAMQVQGQKNCSTTISLVPLSITLEIGLIKANLLLEEVTDGERSQSILNQVLENVSL